MYVALVLSAASSLLLSSLELSDTKVYEPGADADGLGPACTLSCSDLCSPGLPSLRGAPCFWRRRYVALRLAVFDGVFPL